LITSNTDRSNGIIATQRICTMRENKRDKHRHDWSGQEIKSKERERKERDVRDANMWRAIMRVR
jgi:uncharacterized membrane protein